MVDVTQWANTAAGNDKAGPPDYFQEGQTRASLNDCSREVQAAVRRFAEDGGWFDWGHAFTFVSGTSFEVPGDQTAVYTPGRRVRFAQTTTFYGTVLSSAFTTQTLVTVVFGGGELIQNEATSVSVGPSESAVPSEFPSGTVMLFRNDAAPTGWTKNTSLTDAALRITSGTPSTESGGSLGFLTLFSASAATAGHVLTEAQLPTVSIRDPASSTILINNGGGAGFNFSAAGNTTFGSGAAHSHTIGLNVLYASMILATKD